MSETEKEARKALNRLRRAVEKTVREMDALEGAIRHAEGSDFPESEYRRIRDVLSDVKSFTDEEARRLQEKLLQSGGLEPGRIRRSSRGE